MHETHRERPNDERVMAYFSMGKGIDADIQGKPTSQVKKDLYSRIKNQLSSCLSWFMTDNGLYPNMEDHTAPFQHQNWKGRISQYISEEEARTILSCFLSSGKEKFFSLFSVSDYKYTYIGKNLLPEGHDVYLKYYRVKDASLKIRMRNVLRRCLARKGFNVFFQLKKKAIKAAYPLFYVRMKGHWISDIAIFASRGIDRNQTIECLLSDSTNNNENLTRLAMDLGSYVADLQSRGILYAELYRNLIPIDEGTHWDFVLCDLEEMRSISEKRGFRHEKNIEALRNMIKSHGASILHSFNHGYHTQWQIITKRMKFKERKIQSLSLPKYNTKYHLVWCPQYEKNILEQKELRK